MVHIQVVEIQKRRMMCIQRSSNPSDVATRDDIDARVIESREVVLSEKWTWIGSRMGVVVRVCRRVNQAGWE